MEFTDFFNSLKNNENAQIAKRLSIKFSDVKLCFRFSLGLVTRDQASQNAITVISPLREKI